MVTARAAQDLGVQVVARQVLNIRHGQAQAELEPAGVEAGGQDPLASLRDDLTGSRRGVGFGSLSVCPVEAEGAMRPLPNRIQAGPEGAARLPTSWFPIFTASRGIQEAPQADAQEAPQAEEVADEFEQAPQAEEARVAGATQTRDHTNYPWNTTFQGSDGHWGHEKGEKDGWSQRQQHNGSKKGGWGSGSLNSLGYTAYKCATPSCDRMAHAGHTGCCRRCKENDLGAAWPKLR